MNDKPNYAGHLSMGEEVLAVLYLIAGLNAWQAGIRWLAWCLFVKAAMGTVCSLRAAYRAVLHERENTRKACKRP